MFVFHHFQSKQSFRDAHSSEVIKGWGQGIITMKKEERCTSRLWISNSPIWMAIYTPCTSGFFMNKNKVIVKILKTSKDDKWCAGRKVISVYFFAITVPIVLMFHALGVESDFEMMLQDHLNKPNLKTQDPNVLDGFGDHCSISELDKIDSG
ncbi:hypothetical protein SUGI_0776260 [Cryptomeria japonica]|nr:hypothetical protein SUGI_0776260 [Cryptomeria japonica]